jgi:hypothetical protein
MFRELNENRKSATIGLWIQVHFRTIAISLGRVYRIPWNDDNMIDRLWILYYSTRNTVPISTLAVTGKFRPRCAIRHDSS